MERDMVDEPSYKLAYRFRKVLVPITPDERSQIAIEVAKDFYTRYGSHIVFLYIIDNIDKTKEINQLLSKYANDIVYELKVERLKEGETVASAILEEIKRGLYDLVIVESRGRTGIEALLYNSVSTAIALSAPTSVLVLR
ncbi:MAG: universal stress protein [Thermoproteus sp.]|jgi:nucleotide-binding universal stress UspA family protein